MNEPAWVQVARTDLGNPESLAPNDSPLIRRFLGKLSALWLIGQPWCGSIMASWMQQCGIPYPKDYYRAKAWMNWGVPTSAHLGAVVVFERTGGGHVGLVVGTDSAGNLMVLGGNQGDCVSIRAFDRARVLGYRWPPGISPPLTADLPLLASNGTLSRNEA